MSGVHIVLLCEDSQTDSFVRRFLKHRNLRARDITTAPLPSGTQSGEQWVRQRFPEALQAIRQRRGAYLIVVADADALSTAERRQRLDAECERSKIPPRGNEDPVLVLVLVPRRNIETWLAYLAGAEVDETARYPRLPRERCCETHSKELFRMCNKAQKLDEPAPPSLREACEEYRRFQR